MANRLLAPLAAINGGQDFAVLTEKADFYDYENGKRVGDARAGVRLTVALQGSGRLTPLTVKFVGKDPLPNMDDATIASANQAMQFPLVRLVNCVVTIYTVDGRIGFSATADGAELVKVKPSA